MSWVKIGQELIQEITNTDTFDKLALWFIGQVGYVIKANNKIIFIDPVLNDITDDNGNSMRLYDAPFSPGDCPVDYVLCTHGHIDHLAPDTVKGIYKHNKSVKFVVPAGCHQIMEALDINSANIIYLAEEESVTLDTITIMAISSSHPNHVFDRDDPDMALGYEININGKTIIHLGDTYLTVHLYNKLKSMAPPTVFLPPINGDDLFRRMDNCIGNMEAEEAAKLAVILGAKLSIPTHYDMIKGNTVNPLRFLEELDRLGAKDRGIILNKGEKLFI